MFPVQSEVLYNYKMKQGLNGRTMLTELSQLSGFKFLSFVLLLKL